MTNPYACIVPTNAQYLPGALAFVNSFLVYGMERYCDLILPYHGWDPARFENSGCRIVPVPLEAPCEKREICAARNLVAVEYAPRYESLAMFDADMFVTSELRLLFQFAAAGFMVACNNDTHQDGSVFLNAARIPVCPVYNYKMVCSVPFFFSELHARKFYATAFELATAESHQGVIGDLESLNLAICLHPEIWDRMLVLPSSMLTGVHHTNFKPETHHIFDAWDGNLPVPTREHMTPELLVLTADFQRVYSVHGPYWLPGYAESLVRQMNWYYADYLHIESEHVPAWMNRVQQIADRTQALFLRHLLAGRIPFSAIKDLVSAPNLEYIHRRARELGVREGGGL